MQGKFTTGLTRTYQEVGRRTTNILCYKYGYIYRIRIVIIFTIAWFLVNFIEDSKFVWNFNNLISTMKNMSLLFLIAKLQKLFLERKILKYCRTTPAVRIFWYLCMVTIMSWRHGRFLNSARITLKIIHC